jgi:hypothetical protein
MPLANPVTMRRVLFWMELVLLLAITAAAAYFVYET